MKEPYIEGLANHDDPESCVGARKDVGEALTGARAGRAIEPRNPQFGVPTLLTEAEGNTTGRAIASCRRTPRGRRTQACTETPCARTGRSHPRPSGRSPGGPLREGQAARLRCMSVGSQTGP